MKKGRPGGRPFLKNLSGVATGQAPFRTAYDAVPSSSNT
jgi:hypothetical protein